MRTKKSFKYQFQEVWQSIGMLYLVQIGMRLLALLIASKIGGEYVTMNGMNMMSAMFMLIIGMCSFTESFQFLLQNGVSRKQILAGKMLVFAAGAGMCGVADTLLATVDQKAERMGKYQIWRRNFTLVLSRVFRAGIFRCEGNRLSSTAVCSVCTFCRGRVYGVYHLVSSE